MRRVIVLLDRRRRNGEAHLVRALADWHLQYWESGGQYSEEALMAAGEAALRLYRAGHSFDEAFQCGRREFFNFLERAGATESA